MHTVRTSSHPLVVVEEALAGTMGGWGAGEEMGPAAGKQCACLTHSAALKA